MRTASVLAPLVAVIALILAAPPVAAEPRVIEASLEAPDDLTVGDRFHYVIKIEATKDTEVGVAAGALPAELELTGTPSAKTRSLGGGRVEITLDLEIAAFVPGELVIPPVVIVYREPDGTEGSVETGPQTIFVTSVLPSPGEVEPRNLKAQAEIGRASSVMLYTGVLAAVFVALAVVIVLIVRLQRPRPVALPVAAIEELGPEDRARALLAAAGDRFAKDHDYFTYYAAIAVTVRNYLTERYGFPAFALTTRELQAEMGRRGIDRWQARLVDGLLSQCDAAVYASYVPALERADHDLTAAFEIVEMSRPVPLPQPEEEAAVT